MAVARKTFTERRKHERVPIAVPVFIRGIEPDGSEFLEFASALNVSAGGALLASHRPLRPSTTIALEIPAERLPHSKVLPRTVHNMRARLLRVTFSDGLHLCGIRFTAPLKDGSGERKLHSAE